MLSLIILTKFGVAELITLGKDIHNLKVWFKINPLYVKKLFYFFRKHTLGKKKTNPKNKAPKEILIQ